MIGAFLAGLVIGVFVGAMLGVLIMGLLVAARGAYDMRGMIDGQPGNLGDVGLGADLDGDGHCPADDGGAVAQVERERADFYYGLFLEK